MDLILSPHSSADAVFESTRTEQYKTSLASPSEQKKYLTNSQNYDTITTKEREGKPLKTRKEI